MQNSNETNIKKWAKEDPSISQALEIATFAHQGQLDKAGISYINHPIAVAIALGADKPRDTKAVVVALLHDVLEDTKVTAQELKKIFLPEIIDAILAITRRKGEEYITYIRRCAENPLARKVKMADLRDNLDPERLKKLTEADRELLRSQYIPALNYLFSFVDKDKLSQLLEEESRYLQPGTLPHDAMNKAAFVHGEMLASFLRFYVDEPFIEDLDLDQIEPLPNEFITETMRKRYSDCIRKVRWKGRDAYLLIILEFQSTKDIWIPVRVLAYTALLWLDLVKNKLVTREEGLPPVFPVVIHSGSENWNDPLSIHELLSPVAKLLLKYQPDNLALLVDEKTITDEVLNKNSDFYALFLELKRAKTPMAMQEAILKYKEVLSKPEHHELLKTSIAIVEMLYKRFNEDAGASDIRFASLEEAVKMIDSTAIDWKKNMREELYNDFYKEWTQEATVNAKRDVASAMLQEGLSPEMIGRVTKLPLAEIEKLQTQRV